MKDQPHSSKTTPLFRHAWLAFARRLCSKIEEIIPGNMESLSYVLGHDSDELNRLTRQHLMIKPFTNKLIHDSGLLDSRRVLEVGCGFGDVTLMLHDLLDQASSITAVDREQKAVVAASTRLKEMGVSNVNFLHAEPSCIEFEEQFDAVFGRYVLLFQPDAGAWLRRLARHVRPGGLMVFHEPDLQSLRSFPVVPSYEKCSHWVVQTFDGAGTPVVMVDKMHKAFIDAGLDEPQMRLQTFMGGVKTSESWINALCELANSMSDSIEKYGYATADDLEMPRLYERIIQEMKERQSVVIGRTEVGAWCRL